MCVRQIEQSECAGRGGGGGRLGLLFCSTDGQNFVNINYLNLFSELFTLLKIVTTFKTLDKTLASV